MYDSTDDTKTHIEMVQEKMGHIVALLAHRRAIHDDSKLLPPEKPMYDEFTPKLRGLVYGSDEYKECLKQMGPALAHHYANNSHHPEHYPNGINGMTLLDLVEMLADWKAAGMRHNTGSMEKSLEINRQRFGLSEQLFEIFQNTVRELGW